MRDCSRVSWYSFGAHDAHQLTLIPRGCLILCQKKRKNQKKREREKKEEQRLEYKELLGEMATHEEELNGTKLEIWAAGASYDNPRPNVNV